MHTFKRLLSFCVSAWDGNLGSTCPTDARSNILHLGVSCGTLIATIWQLEYVAFIRDYHFAELNERLLEIEKRYYESRPGGERNGEKVIGRDVLEDRAAERVESKWMDYPARCTCRLSSIVAVLKINAISYYVLV